MAPGAGGGAQPFPSALRQLGRLQGCCQYLGGDGSVSPLEPRLVGAPLFLVSPTFVVHRLCSSRAARIFASARLTRLFTVPSGRWCLAANSEWDQPP